ncbi:TetR family transcriptional regulator [Amantichitinum ursilacus]|uniref:HTH-type transcriptional regulator TtgR n=1 Tax=Amantichitinum ursilacus TaxID=857265 RepID=A0A0N0XIL0_9NEIS|nr:TetR family transcriptional regulator [Amantichitinum ursilacus]KPC52781.1 HTH-type transcriptional regulator TtgR [Amantichitinum ursilacus]
MARKTKEEAQETRALILETAERLFSAQGVARTSLHHIADAAGLTRGAIYWHFKNKSDLFNAMADRICLPMETALEPDTTGLYQDPLSQLRQGIVKVMQETTSDERQRRVFDVLFNKCEYTEDIDAVLQRRHAAMKDGAARVQGLLRQAIERGQMPGTLNVQRAEVMLHSILTGALGLWLFEPDRFDLQAEAERMIDAYIDMLRLSPALQQA